MARSYHIDIARHATKADAKWIDNLLSRFALPGVDGGRQGTPRRISTLGIYHIALVHRLHHDLGLNAGDAVSLAGQLLVAPASHVTVARGIEVRLDRVQFERDIDDAIAEAVESVTPARRGRPPMRGSENAG